MLRRLSVKAAPITNRVADYGPVVPACCNVCRTCTTTNLIGAVFGAVAFVGLGAKRLATRFSAKPSSVEGTQRRASSLGDHPQGGVFPRTAPARRPEKGMR